MMSEKQLIKLIINADDYAYFPCTSRGILEVIQTGSITATGILANRTELDQQLEWLKPLKNVDLGVHLNLTMGHPLTKVMESKLVKYGGQFPGLYPMIGLLVRGLISTDDIYKEWQAQIERCQVVDLKFLNSHEHIHMLPLLFPIVIKLADEYKIAHVRQTQPEWLLSTSVNALIRNVLLQAVHLINKSRYKSNTPRLIGLNSSGKLTINYLEKLFATLVPGHTYELMCHPGLFDADEKKNPRLLDYHHWESELNLLKSDEIQALYQKNNIQLCRYA